MHTADTARKPMYNEHFEICHVLCIISIFFILVGSALGNEGTIRM